MAYLVRKSKRKLQGGGIRVGGGEVSVASGVEEVGWKVVQVKEKGAGLWCSEESDHEMNQMMRGPGSDPVGDRRGHPILHPSSPAPDPKTI